MKSIQHISFFIFFFVFLRLPYASFGQDSTVVFKSQVVDEKLEAIGGAYIKNIRSGKVSLTSQTGFFSIECLPGDTLLVMAMSYELEEIIYPQNASIHIQMKALINSLDPVNVYDFRSYEAFKKDVLNLEIEEEEVNVTGLPKGRPSKVPVKYRSNEFASPPGLAAILSPFSALAYYTNSKEKQKRRVLRLIRIEERDQLYWRVMQRDTIQSLLQVPDSLLEDFIIYCNSNIENKALKNPYYYKEMIVKLYPLFLEEKKHENSDVQR